MSQCNALLAFLLIALPIGAQEPVKQDNHPRLDLSGDPLPPGALRRLGTVRFRQEYVHDMAFTPDGKSLVVESPGRLIQWDVATGKPLRIIRTSQSGNYRSLGLSRDGRLVAVRPDDSSVVVFDLSTGKERFRKNVGTQYPGGVISPDHSLIAIGATDGSSLWNLQTGKEHAKLRGTEDLKFSPDGKWIAGWTRGARDERIVLFDAKTGQEHGSVTPINTKDWKDILLGGFGFTPDGKSLIVSWRGSGILIYDIKNQKVARHLKLDAWFVAISPDSKIFAATNERTVILTNIETGTEIRRWQVADTFLGRTYAAFSPDGKTLALGFECGIQLWDPETGKRLDSFHGPVHIPQYLAVSDDAKTIAVLYGRHAGQFLQLFDTETLQEKARIDAKPFTLEHVAFSPDGRRLAFNERPTIDRDKHRPQVRLMDVTAGKEITPEKKIAGLFSHWKDSDTIVAIEMAPNRKASWVAVDAMNGLERDRNPVPKDYGMSIYKPSTSNDRRRMVLVNDRNGAGMDDGQMFLAEWPTGKRIRPLVFPKTDENDRFSMRDFRGLSPDERLILTSGSGQGHVTFSEAATGRERFQLKSGATFSPDGRLIVVSSDEKHTILDSLTFEPLMEFVPTTYYGSSYAFSANGKIMVTGDTSSLLVWDLKTALRARKTSPEELSAIQLRELWVELESADARVGHRAMITLSRRPEEAIAYLRSRLPGAPPDAATFKRLVRELDDPSFKTREAAQNAITQMGVSAGAMIRQALKDSPSLELKARLEALAEKLKFSDGDRVRWLRCVELLERLDTPPARATLELIRNVSDPETSADATRSLERLAVRTR